jgi:hypothetical protein
MEFYEIKTLGQLMRAAQDMKTGGYIVDLEIMPNMERSRHPGNDGFFLVIQAESTEPDITGFNGEWWFWADDTVMQVL